MTSSAYLLDTDILVFMLRGLRPDKADAPRGQSASRIRDRMRHMLDDGHRVCVSTISLCELEYGAARASMQERERRALTKVLAPFERLDADSVLLPRHYGEIRLHLEREGSPIGAMDLLIAAHARSAGAILVTHNLREFQRVPGLRVENWAR